MMTKKQITDKIADEWKGIDRLSKGLEKEIMLATDLNKIAFVYDKVHKLQTALAAVLVLTSVFDGDNNG